MKYVAFLRAINVGGTKVIKMDDLKRIFESFGLTNAQTYIQSGNVIFEARPSPSLEKRIETQLDKALGYPVETFVRGMDELAKIAGAPPFEPQGDDTLHIVFLRGEPENQALQKLLSQQSKADSFAVRGREAYNLRHDRDASVFSNQFIEKTLGLPGTTRNLNTLRKIVEKFG